MKLYYESELYHHGVKGMKWGRRRYQNADGSLTPAGVKRYATKGYSQDSYNSNKTKLGKAYDKYTGAHKIGGKIQYDLSSKKQNEARAKKYLADEQAKKEARNTPEAQAARRKKALKVGAAVAGTALAAYGVYKVNQYVKDNNAKIQAAKQYTRTSKDFERMALHDATMFTATKNSDNPMNYVRVEANPGRDARVAGEYARNTTKFGQAAKNVRNYKRSGGSLRDLQSVNSYKDDPLIFEIDKRKKK